MRIEIHEGLPYTYTDGRGVHHSTITELVEEIQRLDGLMRAFLASNAVGDLTAPDTTVNELLIAWDRFRKEGIVPAKTDHGCPGR